MLEQHPLGIFLEPKKVHTIFRRRQQARANRPCGFQAPVQIYGSKESLEGIA